MKWVIRVVVALFFGFVFFGAIQHYFQLNFWFSIILAMGGASFSALGAALDLQKRSYEIRKLAREEKIAGLEKNKIIQVPTADETRKHGQSPIERKLDAHFRNVGKIPLMPGHFVVDAQEEKL
jgi:hypothetical protein